MLSGSRRNDDVRRGRCAETYRWPHPVTRVSDEDFSTQGYVLSIYIPAHCAELSLYRFDIESAWTHRSGRAEERVAKLVDSPDKPESEASYKLDEGGWADV